ncbi:MAG: SUMF1/EgtB/PvdO family nonheme iron enzyme [Candidatus Accumulibacter phosphatis]|uniref:SUMF1/EgtB/PvdO family nonheme iron enzyme n=2 Tax=Candidatus Accumulibacter TaxID=327159 RepID=UPI001A52B011|nr:SUMF1/EgtB/PvdO family nonheme iron enzyme [Candidatus Accumulibacter phosphatis]
MTIIEQAADLLRPFMGEDRRDTWLTLAFHAEHPDVYHAIPQRGATRDFVVACVRRLLEHGRVGSRHALSLLLEAVCSAAGDERQPAFRALIEELDARCPGGTDLAAAPVSASAPVSAAASSPCVPPLGVRQASARDPRVFISYSRSDRQVADRLFADLQQAGHACWLDTSDIPGGEVWLAAIADGIERAYAVVSLVSTAANTNDWVRLEYLQARKRGKPVFPLLTGDGEPPWYLADRQAIAIGGADYTTGVQRLLRSLPAPPAASAACAMRAPAATQREAELAYLRRLQLGELVHTELYTPMAGVARVLTPAAPAASLPAVVMRPEFRHLLRRSAATAQARSESRAYEDIAQAFVQVRRAALLGEPGAGKTTTLWRLAHDALEAALADAAAPIPLLVSLGKWTETEEGLSAFLERQLGELGIHLASLLASRRAVLLLDGLNEMPAGERAAKAAQVKAFLQQHRALAAMVTCRELDYTGDLSLELDTISIRPLDPPRIFEFVTGYLTHSLESIETDSTAREAAGRARGDDLFWRLAGGEGVREAWRTWQAAGASLSLFWSATEVPRANPDIYSRTTAAMDRAWQQAVHDPRSLLRLAGNPYLLYMLTCVYVDSGDVPQNRAVLFDRFVEVLLLRERLAEEAEAAVEPLRLTTDGERLLAALEGLAWSMQSRRGNAAAHGDDARGDTATAVDRSEAAEWLDSGLLHRAAAASLLAVGEREVRFSHQLLQEYFTARGMRARLASATLHASELWPAARWWERTGWEEAAVLLAGLHGDDCTPVVEWLLQAQPEVAAQCIVGSGARLPDAALRRLRQAWSPRLTDLEHDPEPEARAAVGRALGRLTLGGLPLDDRPGVGVRLDAGRKRLVPDIDWVEVPAGEFRYGEENRRIRLPAFHIARYAITNGQFRCFVDDPQGYADPRWWEGLAERSEHPAEAAWDYANHPRETVSWFEAMAFCRWLSQTLGYEVRLPQEHEWEKAARGADGREFPWGEFASGHANLDEAVAHAGPHYLGLTSAAGIYPQGVSPFGALDMAGNVWEWCLNRYDKPSETDPGGDDGRVVRGGSWGSAREYARCAFRFGPHPGDRYDYLGFRVLCVSPIF